MLHTIFGPYLLWSNGWMHQDATWYGGRTQSRRLCVDGHPAPPQKGAEVGPRLLWPNGCMDQDGTRYGGRPRPARDCVRWGPSSPPVKGHSPQFSANVHCGQTAGWTKMPLGMEVGLGPGDFVFDGDPAPPAEKKAHPPHPIFSSCIVAKQLDGSRCHLVRR